MQQTITQIVVSGSTRRKKQGKKEEGQEGGRKEKGREKKWLIDKHEGIDAKATTRVHEFELTLSWEGEANWLG